MKVKASKFWGIFALSALVLVLVSEVLTAIILHIFSNPQLENYYLIPLYVMPPVSFAFASVIFFLLRERSRKAEIIIKNMEEVARGNYSVRVDEKTGRGEFKEVYANFNKMMDELSSVAMLREDFVRSFSHELKTPLSTINGFASLLSEGGLTEEEQKKFIGIIAAESQRLLGIADNTLILTRLENQQLAGEATEVRLDEQINDCIISMQREWERKNLTLSSDLQRVTVKCDGVLLRQVWCNLLSNAIKFTPDGGAVNVRLAQEGGKISVSVSDTGVGIPEEEREKIFEKYYRSPSAKKTEGNGLGLAICKRICALTGWDISVTSGEGGSTFTVTRG